MQIMIQSKSFRSIQLKFFFPTIFLLLMSNVKIIDTILKVDAFISITPQLPILSLVSSSSTTTARIRTRTNHVPTISIGQNQYQIRRRTNNKQRYQSQQQQFQQQRQLQQSQHLLQLQMCICINCSRVINCAAYHFVETKHNQPHMILEPTFTPQDGSPTIHVNVRTPDRTTTTLTKNNDNTDNYIPIPVVPETTIEYDVVACQDYVQDIGCWIRNMPDEIRTANPDFVPT